MSKGIRVSPRHGLNPTLSVCFWCGKEKNEIALMGYIEGDAEAPRRAVLDYEPCDECKEAFSKGVLIIEVTKQPNDGRPPIAPDAFPTGRAMVVRPEALNGDYKAGDKVLMMQEDFIQAFGESTI